ncbi:MAG: 2-succinyl-5-enolpyruvyl-6-hydroxy-3-cyclohexene-1-carboxylic-acid synthase [Bacteroidales bacterium]|nr:2-succinyl-5-enolpyruvyl-6-hydroxy-3-cyclohexene-1-carboxylic-acid synthase [Bacteroidales bacterium]MDY5448826.1 2-succinyl-5-enolpyruvyl-6-hydroxy-3-cyclohexene-1-carboxylic-acid synthase [Prevotella sp.]
MYSDKENINILTSLLVSYGVRHIVVCPGSRNAPLVHNFDVSPDITTHAVTDERSAAFFALGLRLRLRQPVAVCVTSGSALLNTMPGAAEATYQHEGIIIISADRPQAWIGQLDGQTMPQHGALGTFASPSVSLPEPHNDTERWLCRRLICEAMIANTCPPFPSVHINVPVSEPLFGFSTPCLPDIPPIGIADLDDQNGRETLRRILKGKRRLMVISGQTSDDTAAGFLMDKASGCVFVAEWLSPYGRVRHIDEILRTTCAEELDNMRPDCIVYIGGHTVSKRLRHYMRSLDSRTMFITVSDDGMLHDVSQHTTLVVKATAGDFMRMICNGAICPDADMEFVRRWYDMDNMAARRISASCPPYSQMLAIRRLEENIDNSKDIVCYANSLSVRAGMMYASAYRYCNRGLNGIEGTLSMAAGMAAGAKEEGMTAGNMTAAQNVYCVIGDLSFFYDSNALWIQELAGNMRIMLINNQRGAIFGMLPGLDRSPAHKPLIAAGHNATAEGICSQYGMEYYRATDTPSLEEGIRLLTSGVHDRPVVLEVLTDADTDADAYSKALE